MSAPFQGFDLTHFWEDSDYARKEYVEEPPSDELIASIEKETGFRLPKSYVELMTTQNGGIPVNRCCPCIARTSWAEDHVAITGIMGIGRTKTYSLCGPLGSTFMQEEWGYPDFGICICNCPSAGHDMIMLDYRECGPHGDPTVVHVDQGADFEVTFLASDFEAFIRGLVNDSVYDTSEADLRDSLVKIETGAISTELSRLIEDSNNLSFEQIIRSVCTQVAKTKGCFAFHADELSWLIYDIQFFLFSSSHHATEKSFLEIYPRLIALSDGDLRTGGYAPGFVSDWLKSRIKNAEIQQRPNGTLAFSVGFQQDFFAQIAKYR